MDLHSALFILVFLPGVVFFYNTLAGKFGKRGGYVFLIICSLMFYFINSRESIVYFCVVILLNYVISIAMIKIGGQKAAGAFLVVGIIMNIAVLGWFKYFNMIVDTSNFLFGTDFHLKDFLLPLGISFLCFQEISYLVDVYRNPSIQYGFTDYLVFMTFFPHLTAGPIVRTKDWNKYLLSAKYQFSYNSLAQGIFLFAMGLGKKVLIADVFGGAVNWFYANLNVVNTTDALFISLAYTLQLYYDFSGYCDMAMGVANMLQLDLPLNFNSPYKAVSLSDFWKRWHMTLTGFFTSYVYIPLGGNRKGTFRMALNTMVVFAASGLWHGASYTFLAWGLLHGTFLVLTKLLKSLWDRIPKVLSWLITFFFVDFAWMLFRANSFSVFRSYMKVIGTKSFGALSGEITGCFVPFKNAGMVSDIPQWVFCVVFTMVILIATIFMDNAYELSKKMKDSGFSVVFVVAISFISLISMSGITTFVYQLF